MIFSFDLNSLIYCIHFNISFRLSHSTRFVFSIKDQWLRYDDERQRVFCIFSELSVLKVEEAFILSKSNIIIIIIMEINENGEGNFTIDKVIDAKEVK